MFLRDCSDSLPEKKDGRGKKENQERRSSVKGKRRRDFWKDLARKKKKKKSNGMECKVRFENEKGLPGPEKVFVLYRDERNGR